MTNIKRPFLPIEVFQTLKEFNMKSNIQLFISMFFLLLSSITFAQDNLSPNFKGPRSTMSYFLKAMKKYKNGDSSAIKLAIKPFNTSHLDPATKLNTSILAARQLIQTIDRIKYVKVSEIPDQLESTKWYFSSLDIKNGKEAIKAEISIEMTKDKQWLFTPQTLKTIGHYYKAISHKQVVEGVIKLNDFKTKFKKLMPKFTGKETLSLLNGQWIALFIIMTLGFILERIFKFFVIKFTTKIFFKKSVSLSEKKKKKLTFPMGLIIFSGTWILLIRTIELNDNTLSLFLRLGNVLLTLGAVMTAHHIVDIVAIYFQEIARKSDNKFDDILVPLLRKAGKTFVVAIGLIAIGNSLTLDMKSILTGLGIGGIAFALAAKDTISNLFGSLTVLLDRPFRIGDWVAIEGGIEGSIEEVGLRSTRVRTSYDSLISVPNGTLTNSYIDNYGQRTYRRFSTHLGIEYGTPPKLIETFCEGIRQLILNHPWTRKDMYHVYLNQLGASSLDILLYCFWKVPDRSTELAERHRLLIDVLRLGEELGISFAFPTQTLHLQKSDPTSYESFLEEKDSYVFGKEKAEKIIKGPITMRKPRSGHLDDQDTI